MLARVSTTPPFPERSCGRLLATVLAVAALVAFRGAGVSAQEVRVPSSEFLSAPSTATPPPKLTSPKLTLGEAVRLTLASDPDIARSKQALASAEGRYRETRGTFDFVAEVSPGFRYLQNEIAPFIRKNEDDKRRQIKAVYLAFDELNRSLLQELRNRRGVAPVCPIGFGGASLEGDDFLLDRVDPSETLLRGLDRDLQSPSGAALEASLGIVDISEICSPTPLLDRQGNHSPFLDFYSRLTNVQGILDQLKLENVVNTFAQFPRENVQHAYEISEAISTRALLALERLGAAPEDRLFRLPDDEVRKNPFIEAALAKQFRSGISLRGEFRYESEERNFKDWSLDPSFGGFGINPRFPSIASVTFNVPLLRRRGAVTVAAPERAARLTIEAQREQLRHTLTAETFRTVLSYLSLLGSQQTLTFLEESAGRQRQIVELTEQRLQAGNVPRIDVDRARARAARVDTAVSRARQNVSSSQYALGENMGVDIDTFALAPVAADAFSTDQLATATATIAGALAARRDLKSLERARDASRALADGAAVEMRSQLDLTITAGVSTLYESPVFKYLPDELDALTLTPRIGFDANDIKPEAARQEPTRYYTWEGFVRSVRAEWQPLATVSLSWQLPFGNNQRKGRYAQAQATLSQTQIQATDVDRLIRDNVVSAMRVVERAANALARTRETLAAQREAFDGTLELFRAGDVTIVDILLTEELLTQGQSDLVQAWLGYAAALTRLRFEMGELVIFDSVGQSAESALFNPASILGR